MTKLMKKKEGARILKIKTKSLASQFFSLEDFWDVLFRPPEPTAMAVPSCRYKSGRLLQKTDVEKKVTHTNFFLLHIRKKESATILLTDVLLSTERIRY